MISDAQVASKKFTGSVDAVQLQAQIEKRAHGAQHIGQSSRGSIAAVLDLRPDDWRNLQQRIDGLKVDDMVDSAFPTSQCEVVDSAFVVDRSVQDGRQTQQHDAGLGVEDDLLRSLVDDHYAHPREPVAAVLHRHDQQRAVVLRLYGVFQQGFGQDHGGGIVVDRRRSDQIDVGGRVTVDLDDAISLGGHHHVGGEDRYTLVHLLCPRVDTRTQPAFPSGGHQGVVFIYVTAAAKLLGRGSDAAEVRVDKPVDVDVPAIERHHSRPALPLTRTDVARGSRPCIFPDHPHHRDGTGHQQRGRHRRCERSRDSQMTKPSPPGVGAAA